MIQITGVRVASILTSRNAVFAGLILALLVGLGASYVNAQSVCGALGVYPDGTLTCIPYDPPVCWIWQGCVPVWLYTDPVTEVRYYTCLCRV